MIRLLIVAAALLAVAGGAAFWAYDQTDDGAEAQAELIRWVNVTVEVPKDSGLVVTQGFWGPQSTPPALFIRSRENGDSVIVIDAKTGEVIEDLIQPGDRAAVEAVLRTIAVSALDRTTAPWPYTSQPPSVPRVKAGNITYIPPDPAAGISIVRGVGDGGGGAAFSAGFILVRNGPSALGIDVGTGKVYWETAVIAPEDKEAFDRFISAVEYVGP